MPRKSGDFNYANYVGFQAFSSDEPTHRINNTNWYLKWEQGRPGFFINTENVFKQLSKECFKATASAKSKMEEMAGYQKQVEQYFNKKWSQICPIKEKPKKKQHTTI
jgi:hypothetical protein|tara:strand:+ start:147 stop:467 length:321 start_codon:yes stop_codon:yes gene_type:complete